MFSCPVVVFILGYLVLFGFDSPKSRSIIPPVNGETLRKMQISVAIPCYNGAACIGQSIEAVLAQSSSPDQVLVINDGSTDESQAIIERYPVTVIAHEQNLGLAAARNTAIQAAVGDILVFVDVDAFPARDFLEILSAYYTDDPYLAGVGGQGIESNILSRSDRWRRAHASQGYGRRSCYVQFLYGLCMSFRVSVLREIGGFDVKFRTNAEDMDIGYRLSAAGYRLLYVPEARVFHQRTDDIQSLKRTMAAWYRGAYLAKQKNHAHPWTLFAGTLRRLIWDPCKDIFVERDVTLVPLSFAISWIKFKTLLKTASRKNP